MSIVLRSDRLEVYLDEPAIAGAKTQRFDSSMFITQVVLDGRYKFCVKEPVFLSHPSTGGEGLCSEIKFDEGFQEARVGEPFPKLGVGLLTKTDETYYPYVRHTIRPFERELRPTSDGLCCTTLPFACNGWAARMERWIRLSGNRLTVESCLQNTGSRPLQFLEYVHNFVTIEGLPLSEDYRLDMAVAPQDGKALKYGEVMFGKGKGFSFRGHSKTANMAELDRTEIDNSVPFSWRLSHAKSPASVSECVDFAPAKLAVWAIDNIVSTEVFAGFSIGSGKSAFWSRTWTFSD